MNNHVRIKRALALPIALVALSFAIPSSAQPKNETSATVKEHLDRGQRFYQDGSYDAAMIEFQRAYDATGNYKILYNLAIISGTTNDYASALKYYELYISRADSRTDARGKEVTREIARLLSWRASGSQPTPAAPRCSWTTCSSARSHSPRTSR